MVVNYHDGFKATMAHSAENSWVCFGFKWRRGLISAIIIWYTNFTWAGTPSQVNLIHHLYLVHHLLCGTPSLLCIPSLFRIPPLFDTPSLLCIPSLFRMYYSTHQHLAHHHYLVDHLYLTQQFTHCMPSSPQRTHYVKITSLLRQNGVVLT